MTQSSELQDPLGAESIMDKPVGPGSPDKTKGAESVIDDPVGPDTPDKTKDILVDHTIIIEVKRMLGKEWKDLGRLLGLTENDLGFLERDHQRDGAEMIHQMFNLWTQKFGSKATLSVLIHTLQSVKRNDVADMLSQKFGSGQSSSLQPENHDEVTATRTQMGQWLGNRYTKLTMEGLPNSDEESKSFQQDYVNMKYLCASTTKIIELKDVFSPDAGKSAPTRIVIHGMTGSGKTTTAAKLLYDSAKCKSYLSSFNLVVMISGHNCADTLEDTLINALAMDHLDKGKVLDVIRSPSTRLLLVVDDYEQLTPKIRKQLLTVIRKEHFLESTIVVITRSGNLTSNYEGTNVSDSKWVGMDMKGFVDKTIKIVGLTIDIDKVQDVHIVQNKFNVFGTHPQLLKQLKTILHIWNDGKQIFEIYPLHLALLCKVIADLSTNTNMCLTDIHRKLYELLVEWHLRKEGCTLTPAIDETQIQNSMLEYGQYAFGILTKTTSNPSLHCLATPNNRTTALDLGFNSKIFLTARKPPAVNALLELAAAYFLSKNLFGSTTERNNAVETAALSVRPHWSTQNSLCFAFLVGLTKERSTLLFKALKNHLAEYSYYFGLLGLSLIDASVTDALMDCIMPILSGEWRIPWGCNIQDCPLTARYMEFHNSALHEDLVSYALSHSKIQIFKWDISYPARLPETLDVELLMLDLKAPAVVPGVEQCKVTCKKLHCILSDVFEEQVSESWQIFVDIISSICFHRISFEIRTASNLWLPQIREAATQGRLKDTAINWVVCHIGKKTDDVVEVTKLIENTAVKGLQLVLHHENVKSLQKDVQNVFVTNMGQLVMAAANSKRLDRLVVVNKGQPFSVDWKSVCNKWKWKWVQLSNIRIQNQHDNGSLEVKIRNLDISSADIFQTNGENALKTCKTEVKSLICSFQFLKSVKDISSLTKSVQELDVKIDDTIDGNDFWKLLNQFPNLQVLAVSLLKLEEGIDYTSLEKWCRHSSNCVALRGLEIWGIEANLQLAVNLIDCINMALIETVNTKKLKRDSSSPKRELEYLMFNIGPVEGSEQEIDNTFEKFILVVVKLKQSLKEKILPRLDIVCEEMVVKRMFDTKPHNNASWVDAFPPSEGFSVKHDYWGMSRQDSFRSREIFNSNPLETHRFRITAD